MCAEVNTWICGYAVITAYPFIQNSFKVAGYSAVEPPNVVNRDPLPIFPLRTARNHLGFAALCCNDTEVSRCSAVQPEDMR